MCGLAGWLGSLPDVERHAMAVGNALRHRGPDACGVRSWRDAALVFRRLCIIDLSATGAQPMANEDETIWVVFNGEIYNHHELRAGLQARGHVFRGRADTEVLPHLYEEYGAAFVERLRGMFAFAIYDIRRRTLLLARDRFGIKPLFYAPAKDRVFFASEIRALLEFPDVDTTPDRQAIHDFAAIGCIPAPETLYTGIRALQPGELLEARADAAGIAWNTRLYHRWTIAPDPGLTLDRAAERADALVSQAVARQLESDVPLGALLSGGIDSSLVSSAAQSALARTLQTFNVRFRDQEHDETWAALAVAGHIRSAHQTLDMDDVPGTWAHVTDLLLHAGQPFADTSIFATNAVCRLMRRHITVALSGDGGDESFGGYNLYWQIARIARLQRLPETIWRGAAASLAECARRGLIEERLPRRLREFAGADDIGIVQNMFSWIRDEEHRRLSRANGLLPARRLFEPLWEYQLPRSASRIEHLSALATEVNVRLILPSAFLFKVDIASMRESLEVRVPMLDEDLFEFGLSLPRRLKVEGRMCKRILREVAKRRLPAAVATKEKRGFGVPVDTWVDDEFKASLRDTVLSPSSRLPEYFRPDAYRPVIEAFSEGRDCPGVSRQGVYQRAIMLLAAHLSLCGRDCCHTNTYPQVTHAHTRGDEHISDPGDAERRHVCEAAD